MDGQPPGGKMLNNGQRSLPLSAASRIQPEQPAQPALLAPWLKGAKPESYGAMQQPSHLAALLGPTALGQPPLPSAPWDGPSPSAIYPPAARPRHPRHPARRWCPCTRCTPPKLLPVRGAGGHGHNRRRGCRLIGGVWRLPTRPPIVAGASPEPNSLWALPGNHFAKNACFVFMF